MDRADARHFLRDGKFAGRQLISGFRGQAGGEQAEEQQESGRSVHDDAFISLSMYRTGIEPDSFCIL